MQIDRTTVAGGARAPLLLLVFAGHPSAQGTTGVISGTIVDDSNQAIPRRRGHAEPTNAPTSRARPPAAPMARSRSARCRPASTPCALSSRIPNARKTRERAQRQQPALARQPHAPGRRGHRSADRLRVRHAGRSREQRSHGAPDLEADRTDSDQGPRRDGAPAPDARRPLRRLVGSCSAKTSAR